MATGRIAGRFTRAEIRRQAERLVLGSLVDLPRKNCWSIAEWAGLDEQQVHGYPSWNRWVTLAHTFLAVGKVTDQPIPVSGSSQGSTSPTTSTLHQRAAAADWACFLRAR